MNPKTYARTQLAIMRLSEIIALLPLEDFISYIGSAVAECPIKDIQQRAKAIDALTRVKANAESMLPVKTKRREQQPETDELTNQMNETAAEAWLNALAQ